MTCLTHSHLWNHLEGFPRCHIRLCFLRISLTPASELTVVENLCILMNRAYVLEYLSSNSGSNTDGEWSDLISLCFSFLIFSLSLRLFYFMSYYLGYFLQQFLEHRKHYISTNHCYLFIVYFCLCWVFLPLHRLSLVLVRGAYSLWWHLSLQHTGSLVWFLVPRVWGLQ